MWCGTHIHGCPSCTRFSSVPVSMSTCVPGVSAAGPWNLGTERGEEVEKGPRLDDNVRHGSVGNHHLGRVPDP